jgi:hypothetical protein
LARPRACSASCRADQLFRAHSELLDDDGRRRLHSNPLRILDSKNPALQELIVGAPQLIDHLGAESLAHFEGVQQVLRDAGQPFAINPRLVRGLDYYNLTVFEWVSDRLGAQGTVCAGGRYDGLVRATRRQAGTGLWFRDGRRTADDADARGGGEPERRRSMSMSCIRGKPLRAWRRGLPKACAIRASTSFFIAAAAVSSRR